MMRVVSGLLIRHGSIADEPTVLMGLRGPDKLRPNLWELPGGKIECDETPERALVREWKEELGVDVEIRGYVTTGTFLLERAILVDLFEVALLPGQPDPKPHDHVELRWTDIFTAVKHMPCSPGFYIHFYGIREYLKRSRPPQ